MNKLILALAAVVCAGMIPLSSLAYSPRCEENGCRAASCDGSCSGTGICRNYDGLNADGSASCQGRQASHHEGEPSSIIRHGQGRNGVHHA